MEQFTMKSQKKLPAGSRSSADTGAHADAIMEWMFKGLRISRTLSSVACAAAVLY